MIVSRLLTRIAVAAVTAAVFISLCPVSTQAQQAISAGQAKTKRIKGLDDPHFVGKWDFNKPGSFGQWKPLQAAGSFEQQNGVVQVTAKSQRPCLDLAGPYNAAEIDSIEIRIRCTRVERSTPTESAAGATGGAGDRVRILPQLYQGTRLYFTVNQKEKFDAAKSIEFPVVFDGEFHNLTINPHDHPAWKGLIQKFRLDVGDFPNHYQLDYIYFHRKASSKAKGGTQEKDTAGAGAPALSKESKK